MLKSIAAILVLWSGAALGGDVDSEFPGRALGVQWGSTLQQVQLAYPGGTAYPTLDDEVAYVVAGDFRVLGVDLPVPLIHFVFTKQNQLRRVSWHFRHSDREDALYGIAQALGQDYLVSDEPTGRLFRWKPGRASFAALQIGAGSEFPWALLSVQPVARETAKRP